MKTETVSEQLSKQADAIKAHVAELLGKHSQLLNAIDHPHLVVVSPEGMCAWAKLSVEGQRLQTRVLGAYRKYRDTVKALIRPLPGESASAFAVADDLIAEHLEQNRKTWRRTRQEAIDVTWENIDTMQGLLEQLYSAEGERLFVPDTNALLYNSSLECWQFDEVEQFTIVFTPTVLSELDELKGPHRKPDVRQKAESVIRQIKDYRRRGRLSEGVPVVRDRIMAKSLAIEPDMAETLPWLDPSSKDDRFLASVVEGTCLASATSRNVSRGAAAQELMLSGPSRRVNNFSAISA